MTDLTSRRYNPSPEHCCEACVFGRGEHADWCWICPRCGKAVDLRDCPDAWPGAHECKAS